MKRRSRLSLVMLAFVLLLQSCITSNPLKPSYIMETPIISPGQVLVDDSFLKKPTNKLNSKCIYDAQPVDPIIPVGAPSGYGLDINYEPARDAMIEMGTSCYAGSISQCQSIIEMIASWAIANAAQVKSSGRNSSKYWNDTLTVNLRVVRPFLGAYSIAKTRINPPIETDELIREWMQRTVKRASHLMRHEGRYSWGGAKGEPKAAHNHAAASAAAWMAYGAMWGDESAFERGIEQWFISLGSMRTDGSFPIETRRGARALFYTGRLLSTLMSIAEMAKVQGIDLYEKSPAGDKNIHRAAKFMLDALENNELVVKYARENYVPGRYKDYSTQVLGSYGSTFGWIFPYVSRFPDHPNSDRIKKLRAWELPLCGEWIATCSNCMYNPENR